jgi:hypothetical protein
MARFGQRQTEAQREAEVAEALGGAREAPVQEIAEKPRRKAFERKPFGTFDQKLSYPSRDGFHRHWFNDEPGRIIRAKDAGYTQVEDEHGRPVSTVVGIGRGGQPLVAFLMEIPEEWFREDMAAQEMVVHSLMAQIGRGEHSRPAGPDGELRYAGSNNWGDIKIEAGTRTRR